jgi:hypothetical protein
VFGALTNVRRTLEALARDVEPATFSGEQAARLVHELGAIQHLTEALLGKAAKRVDETSAYAQAGYRNAEHFVARAVGIEAAEARRVIGAAKRLEHLPNVDAAVREGRLSARQAQMVTDAVAVNPAAEQALIDAAAEGMVPLRDACTAARAEVEDPRKRSERQHAARSFRIWSAPDGMVEGHFKVTPEVGGKLKSVFDAETERVFRSNRKDGVREPLDRYAADAFANLVLAEPSAKRGVTTMLHVVIDHGALVRGEVLPGERCEIPGVGPVNVEWARSLLGEAFLTAVIKKGHDIATVAHLGRHVPAAVRTAMVIGGRECEIEGCNHRGYLERDHTHDHAKGGVTALWNLAWLCAVHHRRKTLGWVLGPPDLVTRKRSLEPPPPRERLAS